MNLETAVIKIITKLGIINTQRELPFVAGTTEERRKEEVRPIFWANMPQSYF
jgi:methylenetetrahydrofolate reductase (NADPH)